MMFLSPPSESRALPLTFRHLCTSFVYVMQTATLLSAQIRSRDASKYLITINNLLSGWMTVVRNQSIIWFHVRHGRNLKRYNGYYAISRVLNGTTVLAGSQPIPCLFRDDIIVIRK